MIAPQTIAKCNRDLDAIGHTSVYRCTVNPHANIDKHILDISIRRGNKIAFEYFSTTDLPASSVNALVEALVSAFIAGTKIENPATEYVKTANRWLGLSL
jgi:hypothetical protein